LGKPFLPFTSEKLQKILNIDVHFWNEGGKIDLLKAGDKIKTPEYLFEKIEDSTIEAQMRKLER
jgi:methionyl-tRNA synthetase